MNRMYSMVFGQFRAINKLQSICYRIIIYHFDQKYNYIRYLLLYILPYCFDIDIIFIKGDDYIGSTIYRYGK